MAGFSRNIKVYLTTPDRSVAPTGTLLQVDGKLSSTAQKEESFVQLCTGGGSHDPTKPRFDPNCPTCGIVTRDSLAKGSEVAKDTYVVFDATEVDALKVDDEAYKGSINLTVHDATEVEGQLIPSGTTYYLTPSKGDRMYGLLLAMVEAAPDLAFLGIYTVTSKASMYRVRAFEGVLVLEQLQWPEAILPAPSLGDTPQVPADAAEAVAVAARKSATPFKAENFRNTYAERLRQAVADREATGGVGAPPPLPTAPAKPKSDPFADTLAALVASSGTAPVAGKKAPRKAKAS